MLKKALQFLLRHFRVVLTTVIFTAYYLEVRQLNLVPVIFVALPIVSRLITYLRKKYIASKPASVDRVGDELVVRGLFRHVAVDIYSVTSLRVKNTSFTRMFDTRMLIIQTVQEQINIFVTLEDAQRLAIVMA